MLPSQDIHTVQDNTRVTSPLVAWVDRQRRFLLALAGENAERVGVMLNPCLHSNPALKRLPDGRIAPVRLWVFCLPPSLPHLEALYRQQTQKSGFWGDLKKQALQPSILSSISVQ